MMEWMSYGISVKMSFYVNLILNLNDLCYTRLHTVVNRMEILVILWIMQAKFFMSPSAPDPSTKSVIGLLNPNLKKTWGKIPIFFSKQTNLKIRHLDIPIILIGLLKITSHFLSILPELCDVLWRYQNQTRKCKTPTEK